MGSAMAPSFANLFVGYLEEQHVYVSSHYHEHIIIWFRYIDDVFVIWAGDYHSFDAFVIYLNNLFPGIIFNPVISDTTISFLDV